MGEEARDGRLLRGIPLPPATCGHVSLCWSWEGHDQALASLGALLGHPSDIYSSCGHCHMTGFSWDTQTDSPLHGEGAVCRIEPGPPLGGGEWGSLSNFWGVSCSPLIPFCPILNSSHINIWFKSIKKAESFKNVLGGEPSYYTWLHLSLLSTELRICRHPSTFSSSRRAAPSPPPVLGGPAPSSAPRTELGVLHEEQHLHSASTFPLEKSPQQRNTKPGTW